MYVLQRGESPLEGLKMRLKEVTNCRFILLCMLVLFCKGLRPANIFSIANRTIYLESL